MAEDILANALQSTSDERIQILQTDVGNAAIFRELYGENIRYCHEHRKWLVWNGKQWAMDRKGEIYGKAKKMTNRLWRGVDKFSDDPDRRDSWKKHAKRSESSYRIKAMIELAQSEKGIAVTPDNLDVQPWLLNVENGTLDLKTASLRRQCRKDLITKIAPIPYDKNALCPTWDNFLNEIMSGDSDLVRFLQKAVGYSLTGDTSEQVLFILFGTGANGKSTFINTILHMLGDYALQTATETLLTKNHGTGIRNDVARLHGARFVAAVEAEQGSALAEALVKQLTGGDAVVARFLYGEHFQFYPVFKLFLSVNHRPVIKGIDHGIWRRIQLIPFNVTFRSGDRDPHLSTKLKAELPGILRWAVEGCLLWQEEKLVPPHAVKAATEDYRSDMDVVGDFIRECCEDVTDAKTPFKELFAKYTTWSMNNGDDYPDQKEFAQALTDRGYARGKNKALGRFRWGIKIRLDTAKGDG
jgi:putative DNA primase/helicase